MADENDDKGSNPPAEDPVKQVKSEFSRKYEQLAAQNAALTKQLEHVVGAMTKMSAPQPKKQDGGDDDEDNVDPIDDPKKFRRVVEERAVKRATEIVSRQQQSAAEQQRTLERLVDDYPELKDQDSDMYKRAVEISKQMSESERGTNAGLRASIREAAAELGLLPMKKRTEVRGDFDDGENFSVDSSSNSGSRKRSQQNQSKIDPTSKQFAELLGIDTNDKKYIERLEKASTRKNWGRWG